MGDLWYVALAYGVIWTGLLGYVFRLSRRAHDLGQELDLLREMLSASGAPEIGEETVSPAAAPATGAAGAE
jgi:CcmD family protein